MVMVHEDDTPPTDPADSPRRSWRGLVGWLIVGILLVISLVALAVRVHEKGAGMAIGDRIATGSRPLAPPLSGMRIDGVDNAGLPAWWSTASRKDDHLMVLNFWASWCGPCREESPMLKDVADGYADRGVVVVGADPAAEDATTDARVFIEEFDLDYPMIRVRRDIKEGWGVNGFPETFVIGADHRIAAHVSGPIDGRTLRSLIDAELEGTR